MKQIVGIIEVEDGIPARLDDGGTEVELKAGPYRLSDGVSLQTPIPVTFVTGSSYYDTAGNLRGVWPVKMASFSPASLFAAGQQGFWSGGYDPAQGRLFQDAAGTTHATLPGQPVGLAQRMAGTVDASQATALSRPTLARWPKGGRRNLARGNCNPLASALSRNNLTVTAGGVAPPAGVLADVIKLTENTADGFHSLRQFPVIVGVPQVISVYAKSANRGIALQLGEGSSRVNLSNGATSGSLTTTVTDAGDGWHKIVITANKPNTSSANILMAESKTFYTGDGVSSLYMCGYQLETGTVPTPMQRVYDDYNITEAGVPDLWHLFNDGGDSLSVTLPAGTYGRAWVNADGLVTVDTVVDPVDALVSNQQVDAILRQGAFTPEEEDNIRTYWARYAA